MYKRQEINNTHIDFLTQTLAAYGLVIAPEKVQTVSPYTYLGHKLTLTSSVPEMPQMKIPTSFTLSELQSLLGNINWARPFLNVSTAELSPLFSALSGHSSPADVIPVTPEMRSALQLVSTRLRTASVDRRPSETSALACAIFQQKSSYSSRSVNLPTGIIYSPLSPSQIAIIEWLHLSHTPPKKVYSFVEAVADLFSKLRLRTLQLAGTDPVSVYFPFSPVEVDSLLQTSIPFQVAFAGYHGVVLANPPKDKRLTLFSSLPYTLTSCFTDRPIPAAVTAFTDGSPRRGVVTWKNENGQWDSRFTETHSSAQRSELAAVILAFQVFCNNSFNLVVDTQYVYRLLLHLPFSYLSPTMDKELYCMFSLLQELLQTRSHFVFVTHIRSHSGLPGPLTQGNKIADNLLRSPSVAFSLFTDPVVAHQFFHHSAKALHKQFHIPMSQARNIVSACSTCVTSPLNLPFDAVNPRGTHSNELWQMDVTNVPQLAPLSKLHLTVDTYSGFIWATPLKGETARHVIQHCI